MERQPESKPSGDQPDQAVAPEVVCEHSHFAATVSKEFDAAIIRDAAKVIAVAGVAGALFAFTRRKTRS